jgi:hypothetical protein
MTNDIRSDKRKRGKDITLTTGGWWHVNKKRKDLAT